MEKLLHWVVIGNVTLKESQRYFSDSSVEAVTVEPRPSDTEAGVVGAGGTLLLKAASEDDIGPGDESAD